jgi:hypothetical protein
MHNAANSSFYPLEKGESFHRPEKGESFHRPREGDRFHPPEKREAAFSFTGLRYFPQLETATRKANFQIASEEGLAASTILETNDSLPHLSEDWSHLDSDWPLVLDAFVQGNTSEVNQSPRLQCFLGLDIRETTSAGSLDLLRDPYRGQIYGERSFRSSN